MKADAKKLGPDMAPSQKRGSSTCPLGSRPWVWSPFLLKAIWRPDEGDQIKGWGCRKYVWCQGYGGRERSLKIGTSLMDLDLGASRSLGCCARELT